MRKNYCILLGLLLLTCSVMGQKKAKGLDFDDEEYSTAPKKAKLTRSLDAVPTSASVKMYAPIPKSQGGSHGTCVAWAAGYCGRTIVEAIKNNWTDKELITSKAYSPAFLFRLLKPNDAACEGGSNLATAMEILKTQGDVTFNQVGQLCIPEVTNDHKQIATQYKIKDYLRVFDVNASPSIKIQAVKKSIAEKKPVVIGMKCPPSFDFAKDVWNPKEDPAGSYGGHAMCVVGYDDNMHGGAFEIQNSWGTNWGNKGYIWIRYNDFANFTRYGYEFVDLPEPKPEVADLSGQLKLILDSGEEMPANLLVSTRGLGVVPATVKTIPSPLTTYQVAKAYPSGTRFRMYISNNQPAFVYAISSDLSNAITKIFPYEDGISAALTDKKNDVAIPDEEHFIQFDNVPGKDFLCILYSRDALDINKIVADIAAQKGTFSEKIFAVLGNTMVDPKKVNFSNNKIAFEGFSNGKSAVTLMVEMEHK